MFELKKKMKFKTEKPCRKLRKVLLTVWMEPEVERERTGEKELLYLDRLIFAPRPTVFAALVRSSSADHSESKPSPAPPLQPTATSPLALRSTALNWLK